MTQKNEEPDFELNTTRIETLGDGVFAIAMTLLILEVRVPEFHVDPTPARFASGLLSLWRNSSAT